MRTRNSIAVALICALVALPASAGLGDWLRSLTNEGKSTTGTSSTSSAVSALTSQETVKGLKEALAKGVNYAVDELGKPDGFLSRAEVKIPMPRPMRRVEKLLRKLGQDKYADEFVATMNHAAEKAVTEAGPVFADAIREMSVDDAMKILRGPPDAATQYFRQHTQARLSEKMMPIVKAATNKAGVTSAYKRMTGRLGPAQSLLGEDMGDIDQYVTDKTLDGLFLMIAKEEKNIRENPVARTTDLLKKVFGSVGR